MNSTAIVNSSRPTSRASRRSTARPSQWNSQSAAAKAANDSTSTALSAASVRPSPRLAVSAVAVASAPGPAIRGIASGTRASSIGSAAEGAISGAAWFISDDTPGNADFVKAYRDQYGADPDQFAAQAYTGVYLLATAMKNANSSDPRAIRDALAQLKDVPTVLGSFSFDPSRNPVHPPVVQIVQDGKFTLFK